MDIASRINALSDKDRNLPYPSKKELPKEKWEDEIQKYLRKKNEIAEEFWEACREEVGIPKDHPKLSKLRRIAWDMGHSSGYQEIWNYYLTMSDLLEF